MGVSQTVPFGGPMGSVVPCAETVRMFHSKPACNAGDPALIPGLGRSPGERNGNLLENSMDRGAC